jgi:hypothetical protein
MSICTHHHHHLLLLEVVTETELKSFAFTCGSVEHGQIDAQVTVTNQVTSF